MHRNDNDNHNEQVTPGAVVPEMIALHRGPGGAPGPVTRRGVEKARIRVTFACLISAVERGERHPPVRHLWFPEDRISLYHLRDGNPPADQDRPPHLRGHRLAIDIGEIPQDVWDAVKAQRAQARKMVARPTRMVEVIDDPLIVDHVNRIEDKGLLPRG